MSEWALADWIAGNPGAAKLHQRLIRTLMATAEAHSTDLGQRSPTDQPILTSAACRSIVNGRSGDGIYQAMRRYMRAELPAGHSVADWFWFGVLDAQSDSLVSGDAARGKKGSTAGLVARAQWRDSIVLSPQTWNGLIHKAWELVLQYQGNEDLEVVPYLPLSARPRLQSHLKCWLTGQGSAAAIRSLLWVLAGSWGVHVEGLDAELGGWSEGSWEGTVHYFRVRGYETTDLEYTGVQVAGWQQAEQASLPRSDQYLVHWCAGWSEVIRATVSRYGRETIAVDIRADLGASHSLNIQLNLLSVSPQFLRSEVARLSNVRLDQLRENWGGVCCTTYSKCDASNRRVRRRGEHAGMLMYDNYRDAQDPHSGPMHSAGMQKGIDARAADRLTQALLWVFLSTAESWAMENPEGQLRNRPHMQAVSQYLVPAAWCHFWDPAERAMGYEWEKKSCIWTGRWDGSTWAVGTSLKCGRQCRCGDWGVSARGRRTYTHRGSVENPTRALQLSGLTKEAVKCRCGLLSCRTALTVPAGIPVG
jgi:hypothetical protein